MTLVDDVLKFEEDVVSSGDAVFDRFAAGVQIL